MMIGALPLSVPSFSERAPPLSVASSGDGGRSWSYAGNLEGPERNCCYFSLIFHRDRFFITHYESAPDVSPSGDQSRRNLASMKFGRGELTSCVPAPGQVLSRPAVGCQRNLVRVPGFRISGQGDGINFSAMTPFNRISAVGIRPPTRSINGATWQIEVWQA